MEEMDMPQRLENHEQRITQLESNYGIVTEKISNMEKMQLSTQNVVLKEFSSTKDMLTEQNKLNATLLEQMYGIKTAKLTSRADVLKAAFGAGGIVGVVLGTAWGAITYFI
ncbi:hypothetical protein ACQKFG_15175 [Peribacillus sp. NPDC076916]|uniref:hypothetical protein n=1 Tax=Peribacillus TaxID=2675229 RepID=UPI0021610CF1|nr:hypothetical protein [Peribacillus frigoritolerans]